MYRLTGKTALITGGGGDFGRAIALELARGGASIALADLAPVGLESVVKEVISLGAEVLPVETNVVDSSSVQRMVDAAVNRFGTVDILVNNAGITRDSLLVRMKESDWDAVLAVNLKGTFLCTKAVSRIMMKQRSGRIINIASVVGVMGNSGQANYAASKAGVIGLTKTTAKELASRGITANAIAPGYFATKMTENLPEAAKQDFLQGIPLGRAGRPEDVAYMVAFLSSEEAGYITGQVIHVDGGMVM